MATFRVRWEIDIEATGPAEAARKARRAQQFPRPGYNVGVFDVTPHRGSRVSAVHRFDLDELDGYPNGWPLQDPAFDDAVESYFKRTPRDLA